VIVVERSGLRTTVQDRGRVGLAHLGVPRSGAADRFSAGLANLVVGNPVDAAVLETTLTGPTLRFETSVVVAVTGAIADVLLDGEPVDYGVAARISPGQRLSVGTAREGLRCYLALAGGVDVAPVLGSRSTDTLSGIGPASLTAGQVLPIGALPIASSGSVAAPIGAGEELEELLSSVLPRARRKVRVIRGPDASDATMNSLCSQRFSVSPNSDRVGVRLTGPAVPGGGEAPTAGMVAGAIQLPPDGAPVVLLADHAVTGGYRVAAVVIDADLPVVAQSRPGVGVEFQEVTAPAVRKAWLARG
jgi:biotin-dependent carboxylase-like uncharacterized protein